MVDHNPSLGTPMVETPSVVLDRRKTYLQAPQKYSEANERQRLIQREMNYPNLLRARPSTATNISRAAAKRPRLRSRRRPFVPLGKGPTIRSIAWSARRQLVDKARRRCVRRGQSGGYRPARDSVRGVLSKNN